jgi:hypothetical protein
LRGSDVVRLGPTDIDTYQGREAFALTTQKRKRDVWCPIMPPLASEMATWSDGRVRICCSGMPSRSRASEHKLAVLPRLSCGR